MPVEIIDAAGKLLQLKLRGMFKKADHDRIIQIAKEAIEREGKVDALIILAAFEGWERRGDWGDVSFMMEQGQHIEKIAIVGDEHLSIRAEWNRVTAQIPKPPFTQRQAERHHLDG